MLPEWPTWRYQLKAGVFTSCGPHHLHRLHLQSTEGAQHQVHAVVPNMKACIAQLHLCSQTSLLQAVVLTHMSVAQIVEMQELIRQVGLAPTKAKNICNMSKVCCCGCVMSNVCFCSDVL